MMNTVTRYRYRYSGAQMYRALLVLFPAVKTLIRNRQEKTISDEFTERLMLAVTEVNGCAVCSYAHTRMALESGFTQEEVDSFLSGSDVYVKPEESKAILFAQSYADAHGELIPESFSALQEEYGEEKSEIILSAVRVMMVGNIWGLPMSALSSRFKGEPYENSSLLYEIWMIIAPVLLLPVSALEVLARKSGLLS